MTESRTRPMAGWWILMAVLAGVLVAAPGFSQAGAGSPPATHGDPAPATTDPPPPSPPPQPASATTASTMAPATGGEVPPARVVDVYAVDRVGGRLKRRLLESGSRLDIGDAVAVEIEGLDAWLAQAEKTICDVVLYLNGRSTDLLPTSCQPTGNILHYNLAAIDRDAGDELNNGWDYLLRNREGPLHAAAEVAISVGFGGDPPAPALPTAIAGDRAKTLVLIMKGQAVAAAIFFVIVFGIFIWLVRTTNILRDDQSAWGKAKPPYSLARTQMAFWTFLVVGGFMLISAITGASASIPASILGLMGIASGTYLGAKMVDTTKEEEPAPAGDVAGAGSPPATTAADDPAASSQAAEAPADPAAPPAAAAVPPTRQVRTGIKGFLLDILSDDEGVELHRFQMFVWTLVLGGVYIFKVMSDLAMPDFNANLVGLMGISAGTYIGFKFPEDSK